VSRLGKTRGCHRAEMPEPKNRNLHRSVTVSVSPAFELHGGLLKTRGVY
jgi:hypothetical protein